MEKIFICIVFVSAVIFIGRKIILDFSSKRDCPKGCGNCEVEKES